MEGLYPTPRYEPSIFPCKEHFRKSPSSPARYLPKWFSALQLLWKFHVLTWRRISAPWRGGRRWCYVMQSPVENEDAIGITDCSCYSHFVSPDWPVCFLRLWLCIRDCLEQRGIGILPGRCCAGICICLCRLFFDSPCTGGMRRSSVRLSLLIWFPGWGLKFSRCSILRVPLGTLLFSIFFWLVVS